MSLFLKPETVDWVIRRFRWIMLAGAALFALGCRLSSGLGLCTCVFLIGLGASGGAFGKWKHERGLWMLACVFLALFLPTYAVLEYFSLAELHKGVGPGQLLNYGDFAAGVATLAFQVRWLLTIAWHNYQLRDQPPGRES